jgi:ditrans,polycis-polyprenyl diphosphate synthase
VENSSLVERLGIRIRVTGDLNLLPKPVQVAAIKAMNSTRQNSKAILNICCPYTARDEITVAMSDMIRGVHLGLLRKEDLDDDLMDKCMFTGDLPPLEVLVRTSGEIRLSDYMTWQASEGCLIHFTNVLWPEFSLLDMLQVIFNFQINHNRRKAPKENTEHLSVKETEGSKRKEAFLIWLRKKREGNPLF